jgi:small subunit ribosomal protein S1
MLKAGESVEAIVLGVNAADKRIALGLKQALGDPWEEVTKRFPVDSIVEGPVTQLKQFGAFVQVAEDIEGMIHVGDIVNEKRINHPQDILKVGQIVKALVLENDREKRRLRLGLKQLQPTSVDEFIAEHKEGETVTGRVSDVKGNRVTVELGEGVHATFSLAPQEQKTEQRAANVDLSALSSMLASKWKGGPGSGGAGEAAEKKDIPKQGQVRAFRIVKLDAEKKKIEIQPAD